MVKVIESNLLGFFTFLEEKSKNMGASAFSYLIIGITLDKIASVRTEEEVFEIHDVKGNKTGKHGKEVFQIIEFIPEFKKEKIAIKLGASSINSNYFTVYGSSIIDYNEETEMGLEGFSSKDYYREGEIIDLSKLIIGKKIISNGSENEIFSLDFELLKKFKEETQQTFKNHFSYNGELSLYIYSGLSY